MEEIAKNLGKYITIGAGVGSADGVVLRLHILPDFNPAFGHERAYAGFVRYAADPAEARWIELRTLAVTEQRFERDAACESGEDGAVPRCGVVEIVDRTQAARARHVLHQNGRVVRNVARHVAGKRSRIEIVAAARTETTKNADGLAGK